ncbi:MAG: ABC transporter substrate-binding protein [Deltaproteobacteria bacterium]|nr:ABC transporter substrate-binding protein [Deltaproteobacteria bacterium]
MGILAYRTGPFAAGGSGFSSGMEDYMELMNMKDGINGIKYAFEECETAYNTARGWSATTALKTG